MDNSYRRITPYLLSSSAYPSSLGFGSHAISGIVGNILAGFVQARVAGADGITTIPGGWLDQHSATLFNLVSSSRTLSLALLTFSS